MFVERWTEDKDAEVWNLKRCRKKTHLKQKRDPYPLVLACGALLSNVMWILQRRKFDKKKSLLISVERIKTPHRQMICCSLCFYWELELCTNIWLKQHIFCKYRIYPRIMRNTWQSQIIAFCLRVLFISISISIQKGFFLLFFDKMWTIFIMLLFALKFVHGATFIHLFDNESQEEREGERERKIQMFGRPEWMLPEKVKRIFIQSLFEILLENITLANKTVQKFKSIIHYLIIWHETVAFGKCWKNCTWN